MYHYLREISLQMNIIAIVLSISYSHVFGALWYTIIFKKQWYELTGITETKITFNVELLGIILNTVTFTLNVIGFSVLYTILQPTLAVETSMVPWVSGYILAGFIWICFIVPSGLFHVLFAKKPMELWFIDSFFWLGNLIGIATIINFWR